MSVQLDLLRLGMSLALSSIFTGRARLLPSRKLKAPWSKLRVILLICIAISVNGCGREKPNASNTSPERTEELALFTNAIRIVQERYVNVDQVQLTHIISNSLKGVVTTIDPYAEIYYTGLPPEESIPEDVALLEAEGPTENGLLVLRVFGFNEKLKKQAKKLHGSLRNRSVSAILIDCRGSYGQDYEAAAALADWFLPKGLALGSLEKEQGKDVTTFTSRRRATWRTNTVVFLVDNTLKGPAEFLAAALRANERCVLVGQPSRGMAVIQEPIKLTDEWSVLLSTGRAREPGGRLFNGNPIIPDIIAQPDPGSEENVDWVFLRGMAVLKDREAFSESE